MSKQTVIEVDMLSRERVGCSRNGNPRFRITTDKGTFLTAPDASVSYDIENWFHRQTGMNRHSVKFTLNGRGHVVNVEQA